MIRHHHDMFYRDLARTDALLSGPRTETELRRYWSYVRGGDVDAITPEAVSPYSGLMADSQAMVADHILAAHDFGRYHRLIDVGGGDGAFVAAAAKAHPELGVAVFDLPSVADRARIHLSAQGLGGRRFTFQGGDFTIDPLDGEADCVSLIRILCDHDDDRVRRILANLHASMRPGTRNIVAEAMADTQRGRAWPQPISASISSPWARAAAAPTARSPAFLKRADFGIHSGSPRPIR